MAQVKKFFGQLLSVIWLLSLPAAAADLTLRPATVNAWNEYLRRTQARVENEAPLKTAAERSPQVKVVPAAGNGIVTVPNGLIHDWVGTTFVPNATLAQLYAVIHDYDHYKDIYTPSVIDSKALATGDKTETFSMELFRKVLNISTAIDADYANRQVTITGDSGYIITRSTRIQEVRNFGEQSEAKLPADTGSGFIWRICSILRYQQADGGVYLRLEAIVLSRDIPHAVRWVANPVVNHLSRNSVAATLTQTGEAVQTRSARLAGDAVAQAR